MRKGKYYKIFRICILDGDVYKNVSFIDIWHLIKVYSIVILDMKMEEFVCTLRLRLVRTRYRIAKIEQIGCLIWAVRKLGY